MAGIEVASEKIFIYLYVAINNVIWRSGSLQGRDESQEILSSTPSTTKLQLK
jgi:hypothetical protein